MLIDPEMARRIGEGMTREGKTILILPHTSTHFGGVIPKGNVPQSDARTMVTRTITKQLERQMWVVVKAWGDNYYDIQLGSTFVLDFDFQTGKLANTGNFSNANVERYSRVFNSTGIKLETGDQCRIAFRDHDVQQKPYIKSSNRMPSGQRTTTDPPSPSASPSASDGVWLQGAASIRKDWFGYTDLNFSSIEAPHIGDDWTILLEIEGSDRVGYFDFMQPNVLVVEETYTDMPSEDVNKKLITLVVFSHRINGGNIESFLYLYKLKGRTDVSPTRGPISSLFGEDFPTEVSLPIQAWRLPFDINGVAKNVPSTASNGYARTYNNTLHLDLDGDGNATEIFSDSFDRVHVTFLQPPIIQVDGIAPPVGTTTVIVTESFTYQTDGTTHEFTLDHAHVSLIEITIDEEGFGEGLSPDDYLSDYSITGDDNDKLTITTYNSSVDGVPIEFTLHVQYSYEEVATTGEVFNVFEVNLNMLSTQIMTKTCKVPSVQVNGVYNPSVEETPAYWTWSGFMGSMHVSVAMNVMCQAHIAGEKAIFSRRAKEIDEQVLNWMEWKPAVAPAWNELIPEIDSDFPRHKPAFHFFNHSPTMNNAPAKIKDANIYRRRPASDPVGTMIPSDTEFLEDGWILPYYSLYGDNLDYLEEDVAAELYGGVYRSILWLVFCRLTDEGDFSHNAFKLLERTNPSPSDFIRLDSLDAAGTAYIKGIYESLYSMTFEVTTSEDRIKDYYCPEVVDCDSNGRPNLFSGYGGTTSCEDPCFDNCERSPESSGCFCWKYEEEVRHRLLGVDYLTFHWGGYIEGDDRVYDKFGTMYPSAGTPDVNKQGLVNVIIPLPLSSPNTLPANIYRCMWTSRSQGSFALSGARDTIDPRVAVSPEDGMIYMVIIEAKFLYMPSTLGHFIIDTSPNEEEQPPDPEGYPEPEEVLCGNTYTCWSYSLIFTSCESCSAGPYEGEGDEDWGYVKAGPYVCSNEVKLNLSDITGDNYQKYTVYGRRVVRELRETKLVISNKAATSVLTVPICRKFTGVPISFNDETILISEELPCPENCWDIALWKGFVLLLIDARDDFKYSPRPVLQIHDRMTGAKVAEYKTIIPDAIYADRYPESEDEETSLKTKWKMWGRQIAEHCPGPAFKLCQQLDVEGVDGDENKPLFIHISADIYEIPDDTGPTSVESRREYRILKFEGGTVTEVRSMSESLDTDVTGSSVDQDVVFPDTYPSPKALRNMALIKTEDFLPAIEYDVSGDFEGWRLISHHLEA